MVVLLYLLLSLFALWLGTEFLIRGVLKIAESYNFSHVFIGLTVLAIGTDLPELFVAIEASIIKMEASGVVIGNSLGSCIAQISVVLGISGLTGYLTLTKKQIFGEGLILIVAIVLTALVAYDGEVSQTDGLILILAYLVYYISLLRTERVSPEPSPYTRMNKWGAIVLIIVGFTVVLLASEKVVLNAVALAERWGVEQSFVGIIIISLGTSLPELAVSMAAALKGSPGLSVGNIIGSNIFDIWVPVGIAAAIKPLEVSMNHLLPDFIILAGLSALVLVFFYRIKGLKMKEAVTLIILYVVYMSYKIIQNLI